MSEAEYKFTNKYGLPILDDSPMDAQKGDAYFKFLENEIKKETDRQDSVVEPREMIMMA